jgi:hypothetical protein
VSCIIQRGARTPQPRVTLPCFTSSTCPTSLTTRPLYCCRSEAGILTATYEGTSVRLLGETLRLN